MPLTNNMHELMYAVACRDGGGAIGEVQRLPQRASSRRT